MYNFAELMLPDGAHKRDEDTTVFLHVIDFLLRLIALQQVFMLRRAPLVKSSMGANHLRQVTQTCEACAQL